MKKGLFVMIFFGLFPASSCVHANGWETNGPYGGYINVLALDPVDSLLIYAGTEGNGIYKTIDGGENWAITSLSSYRIYDIEVDSHQNIYVGTYKNGAFKSTDKGSTYTQIGFDSLTIRDIVIDPLNDSIIYVATTGIYKSTSSGESWILLAFEDTSVGAIAIHPIAPETIYAGVIDLGVYKSTDGGINWEKKGDFHLRAWTKVALAINPTAPNIIYAGYYRSTNAGEIWTQFKGIAFNDMLIIEPSPFDSAIVYAGDGACLSPPEKIGFLYKSTDAGSTFTETMKGMLYGPVLSIVMDSRNPNKVYATTYGPGVYRSMNKGETWEWMSNGMQLLWMRNISISPIDGIAFAGSCEGVYKSTDNAKSWTNVSDRFGATTIAWISVAPSGPDTIYLSTLFASEEPYSSYRSFDNGKTWEEMAGKGLSPILVNPLNAKEFYAVENDGPLDRHRIQKSVDAGSTITCVLNLDYTDSTINSVAIDPVDTNIVYAGGGIYSGSAWVLKSGDGGNNWENTSNSLPNGKVQDLKVNPFDRQILYAAVDSGYYYRGRGRFFRYNDSLWEERGNGLDTFAIYSIAVDDSVSGTLYLGTYGGGVYGTTNEGLNWTQMNDGLVNLHVNSVAVDPTNHKRVYIGTGSGAYVIMTTGVEENPVDKILQGLSISPNPLFGDTYISYQVSTTTHLSLKIYNVSGQLMHTLIEKKILPGRYKTYWNTEELAGGIYFARLTAGKYTSTKKLILIK